MCFRNLFKPVNDEVINQISQLPNYQLDEDYDDMVTNDAGINVWYGNQHPINQFGNQREPTRTNVLKKQWFYIESRNETIMIGAAL